MARALVLGATGHIGAHVVRALLAAGHTVRAAYRRERFAFVLDGLPVERRRVDVETLDGLPTALDGCDWVFHAAGYYPLLPGRRRRALARGVEGTRRLLDAVARAKPRRVVFTSSAAALEGRGPTALYAQVKTAMEQEVLRAAAQGLPAVVVNPSVCLGEYDAHAFSGRLILVCAKHPWLFNARGAFNAIYTGDVGVGQVRAAEQGRIGERYVMTCQQVTWQEFAGLVAQTVGKRPPRLRMPWTLHQAGTLDAGRAIRELALPQTPVEDAVRRAVAWFRASNLLQ